MNQPADKALVESYFRAMQAGLSGENELIELFADDAVYIEPFTPPAGGTHEGKTAIADWIRGPGRQRPDDLKVTVNRIDVDAGKVRSEWTCTSATFPAPVTGTDVYEVRNGKIARLESKMNF
ncbi:MAG: nuclear transport factor 2 family protein [Dehalococcoidia bacterium]